MSRLSREQQQDQQRDGALPATPDGALPAAPVDVRVHAGGGVGGGPGAGAVTVDGAPLVPAPGEEPQQSVLKHLHRIARSTGRPVLATVHDERIGYVVPLQVNPDGSSHFTNRPSPAPQSSTPPSPVPAVTPGTVAPPTGAFGPPPAMDTERHPAPATAPVAPDPSGTPSPTATPGPTGTPRPTGAPSPSTPRPTGSPSPTITPGPTSTPSPNRTATNPTRTPDPKPTPPRGFDAVAEALLGDDTPEHAAARTPLAEPLARIGEAVKEGRIDTASALADQALRDGAAMLGPEHPEVLRLGELTAYVAYLAGDPLRAFRLSVDLVHARRRTGDAEAAYGNVQSAATAWRAVRDPLCGLELGHELIALWSALAAEPGPAAEDADELESARTRMTRLTDRARKAATRPPGE